VTVMALGVTRLLFLLLAFVISLNVCATHILRHLVDHRHRLNYSRVGRAVSLHTHQITIAIKQNNLDVVENSLYEVSEMTSPKYGQHLSFEEVGNLVANPTGTNAVLSWLRDCKVNIIHTSSYGEYIVAEAPVYLWENMFQTEFFELSLSPQFLSMVGERHSHQKVIRASSYSVPSHLDHFIDGVMAITTLPPPPKSSSNFRKSTRTTNTNLRHSIERESLLETSDYADPNTLTSYYNVYGDGYGKGNQTIFAAINQGFLQSDIALFQSQYGLPKKPVDKIYGWNIPNGDSCVGSSGASNCGEASLDLQYIIAMAKNVSTTYWYDWNSDGSFTNFIVNVSSFVHPSLVFSLSYLSYELYVGEETVSAFNIEAMKLGARGVTIIAASGDDGVAGVT